MGCHHTANFPTGGYDDDDGDDDDKDYGDDGDVFGLLINARTGFVAPILSVSPDCRSCSAAASAGALAPDSRSCSAAAPSSSPRGASMALSEAVSNEALEALPVSGSPQTSSDDVAWCEPFPEPFDAFRLLRVAAFAPWSRGFCFRCAVALLRRGEQRRRRGRRHEETRCLG